MDETVFSDHVRELLSGTFDNTQAILSHLHRVVRRRLKTIGQWNLPPKYLGYDGESWQHPGAMDDLVQDVYLVCIQKRLTKLGEHLERTGTCEGSVHWKLKKYLSDRQEKGNPIARRVFRNVRCASESLVEDDKADCSCSDRLTGKSIILSPGQQSAEAVDDLEDYFAEQIGDADFMKAVHRESPASWRAIEAAVENRFSHGMTGYKLGDLSKVLGDACKRPGVVSANELDGGDDEKSILDFHAETRTTSIEQRYQAKVELEPWIASLIEHAKTNVSNARIRARVLNTLAVVSELIQEGQDIRELSIRKLADRLGISKSTLGEDFARLQNYDWMQEASENETES